MPGRGAPALAYDHAREGADTAPLLELRLPWLRREARCAHGKERRVTLWEHEAVLDRVQARLDREPEKMRLRRQTVEHPFGTMKSWMGYTHFLTKTLPRVRTEMSLHVLAYNLTQVMNILGTGSLLAAINA